jgi:REP element-mobilizing transposase RayT
MRSFSKHNQGHGMPQSLAKIYIHIVFSTKNRFPFLGDVLIRNEMHSYLGGVCNALDCPVLTVGGTADHIHILCLLSKNRAASELIGEIKRTSSKWAKTKGLMLEKFGWQTGYGVFSVEASGVETLRSYIVHQDEHHRKQSFQDEYRRLLNHFQVHYDERFIWD